jgi:DNA-binding HxlR family transcriptional regulator
MKANTQWRPRRGYGQFCPAATALDIVGERWTLLIVRDLLMGPKRYTDLREGLPGIATDLLAARLRTLEGAGLVAQRTLPRPAPATVYELTERGRMLVPVVGGLARLGFTMLGDPGDDADVSAERLVLALQSSFRPQAVPDLDATYQLLLGEEGFVLTVKGGELAVARGMAPHADLTIETDPVALVRFLQGEAQLEGPRKPLEEFRTVFGWR